MAILLCAATAVAHDDHGTASVDAAGCAVTYSTLPTIPRAGALITVALAALDEGKNPSPVTGVVLRHPTSPEDPVLASLHLDPEGRQNATMVLHETGTWSVSVSVEGCDEALEWNITAYPPREHRAKLRLAQDQVLAAGVPTILRIEVVSDADGVPVPPPADAALLIDRWEEDSSRPGRDDRVPLGVSDENGSLVLRHAFTSPGHYGLHFESASLGLSVGDQPPMHVLVVAIGSDALDLTPVQRSVPWLTLAGMIVAAATVALLRRKPSG